MKKALLSITLVTLLSVLIYSCSSDDDDSAVSIVIQTPTPEPEETTTQYTLTVSAGDGGSVSSEGGTYDSGTQITINANPDNKHQFVSWSNGSTNPSLSITITENISITANFRLNGMIFTRNSFNIINPNQRKIDLLMTLNSNPGIFVYQKNNFKYLIVPGVSDGEQTIRETSPRGKTFVFYNDNNGWSDYSIENDEASTWVIRNFDSNSDFFILGDANEIGDDWRNWKGDIIKGTPNEGSISWERINSIEQMGFYHDVSVGNMNSDDIPDILGVGFKFFLGRDTGGYDFIGEDEDSNYENPFIDYRFNRSFAFDLFDLDGDGIDEIISADYRESYGTQESNRISIHKFNVEEEKFKEVFTSNSPTELFNDDRHASSIQVYDFNNDGNSDVSVARENSSGESFEIWINNGDLTFTPIFSKKFECNQFNMLEFEVFDANSDGNLDIILRPETCGGQPTESFLYSSYSENGRGLKLNDCIWLNDGTGNFNVYSDKELISPLWTSYLFPYLENGVLHFVGFEFESYEYDDENNSLKIDVIDFGVDIR